MKKPKINLQEKQLDKLKEIGSHLKQIRTDQGLSVENIAQKTCIQSRLLRGIEEANMAILPEPIYIRGFIKQYADALNLNGSEIAADFPIDFSIQPLKSTIWTKLPSFQLRPFHLYFLYVALVISSVQGISQQMQKTALELGGISSISNKPESSLSSIQAVSITPKPNINNLEQPVTVDIKLKDECWLKIVVDGKTEFEGVLPQGTHQTWTANEQLTVKAGNAGGVLVALNKEEAKSLGKPGQVQEVTYQAKARS